MQRRDLRVTALTNFYNDLFTAFSSGDYFVNLNVNHMYDVLSGKIIDLLNKNCSLKDRVVKLTGLHS